MMPTPSNDRPKVTRADRVRQVLAYRDEHPDAPTNEIAAALGLKRCYVWELLKDPDGRKARRSHQAHEERKRREAAGANQIAPAGVCSCGAALSRYRGLVDPDRPWYGYETLCAPCAASSGEYVVTCEIAHTLPSTPRRYARRGRTVAA